jgi:hypothetical protein
VGGRSVGGQAARRPAALPQEPPARSRRAQLQVETGAYTHVIFDVRADAVQALPAELRGALWLPGTPLRRQLPTAPARRARTRSPRLTPSLTARPPPLRPGFPPVAVKDVGAALQSADTWEARFHGVPLPPRHAMLVFVGDAEGEQDVAAVAAAARVR